MRMADNDCNLLKIMVLSAIMVVFSGCALLTPFKSLTTNPSKPATETNKSTRYERIQDIKKGLDYTLKETSYNKEIKQQTFGQRIGGFIAGLSNWAIILLIAGLILFPGGTIAFLLGRIRALGKALFQNVKAIQKAKQNGGDYLQQLKQVQDTESKLIINNMRARLQA